MQRKACVFYRSVKSIVSGVTELCVVRDTDTYTTYQGLGLVSGRVAWATRWPVLAPRGHLLTPGLTPVHFSELPRLRSENKMIPT